MATDSSNPYGTTIELSEMAAQSGDGVLIYSAAGAPSFLPSGTAFQSLRVNAAGTALEFGGAGALELIETITAATAANIDFTDITGFDYLLLVLNITGSAGSSNPLKLTMNNDTGTNYDHKTISASAVAATTGAANLPLTNDLRSDRSYSGVIYIAVKENDATNNLHGVHALGGDLTGTTNLHTGLWKTSGDVTRVTITPTTGTVTGAASLYGLKTS